MEDEPETLFDKYGWLRTTRVVHDFYEDLLQDPTLGHFFDRVSITELAEHQTIFLTMVMGGPMGYTTGDVARSHSGMHIGHDEFEATIRHLETRLQSNGFEPDDIDRIIATYRRYESSVVITPRG
jgi:hemoglobin